MQHHASTFLSRIAQARKLIPASVLLSLADKASSRLASGQVEAVAVYNEFIADMLQKYYNQGHLYVSPPRLLDGAEVCSLLDYNG